MIPESLTILARPEPAAPRMVLGFSGWMDGGDVSTGTIEHLVDKLEAQPLAEIDPEGFYIQSFPGSMEVSALFRPHVEIVDGLITSYTLPTSTFRYAPKADVILFEGREPNLHWERYAECIFAVAEQFDVKMIYFIGSVAGVTPHTRDPRMSSSVSHEHLKEPMSALGVRFSNYEGPASFVTYLTTLARRRDVPLATLVAEVPAYIRGTNPRGIEAMTRWISAALGLQMDVEDLRATSDEFERRVNELAAEREDLLELIGKLEGDYDNELFDTEMGDLKDWLEQRGIRLD